MDGRAWLAERFTGWAGSHDRWRRQPLRPRSSGETRRAARLAQQLGAERRLARWRTWRDLCPCAARTLEGHAGAVGIDLVSLRRRGGLSSSAASGAASFAGRLAERDLDAARSRDGAPFREALAAAGLAGKPRSDSMPSRTVAFLEAHIEQGPRLEAAGIDIGIVEDRRLPTPGRALRRPRRSCRHDADGHAPRRGAPHVRLCQRRQRGAVAPGVAAIGVEHRHRPRRTRSGQHRPVGRRDHGGISRPRRNRPRPA